MLLLAKFSHMNWFQMQAIIMSHVFYLIYVGLAEPHNTKADRALDLANECLLIVSSYSLLVFSPWVPNPYARHTIGWVLMAIVMITFVINFCFLLWPICYRIRRARYLAKVSRRSFISVLRKISKTKESLSYKKYLEEEAAFKD